MARKTTFRAILTLGWNDRPGNRETVRGNGRSAQQALRTALRRARIHKDADWIEGGAWPVGEQAQPFRAPSAD